MQVGTSKSPAFANTTVMSTRKDSGIDGVILRRRVTSDGQRFTTAEVPEAMLELLLTIPGGLKRRNTAINPDSIARAVELHKSGRTRVECEKELSVSSGTYRRLLAAGGVNTRKYTAVLTEDNILQALKVSVKYDLRKRGDIIKASKEVGVNSRTLRRLLSRALETMPMEQVTAIIAAEKQRLVTEATKQESEVTDVNMNKAKDKQGVGSGRGSTKQNTEGASVAKDMHIDELTPVPVRDAVERGDNHTAETNLDLSPLVPVQPHKVKVAAKGDDPMKHSIEQATLLKNVGTSLDAPHVGGSKDPSAGSGQYPKGDAVAGRVAAQKPIDAADQHLQMVPPVAPVDPLDRTVPNLVPGGTHVEPIETTSDVEELKAQSINDPQRDGKRVDVDNELISQGDVGQHNANVHKEVAAHVAKGNDQPK